MKEKTSDIGVIIGRFQLNELHSAHKDLLETVLNNHDKTILFIGCTPAIGTRKNPLDFMTRKYMIEEEYSFSAILPLYDQKSDEVWSKQIDTKIRETFPMGSVTIYGSRDSFIPYYKGSFQTKELEPETYVSATEVRNKVAKSIMKSSEFRAGILYSVYNQYPITHPTVDVVIKKENGDILLGRKPNENKWRFIGGFVDPTDESLEMAAKREAREETGLELDNFKFISSRKVNDWRYRGISERGIMTTFFEASYIFGAPQPNDDICELKWFKLDAQLRSDLVEEHIKLFVDYLNFLNYEFK